MAFGFLTIFYRFIHWRNMVDTYWLVFAKWCSILSSAA
jgi:hypothetical protein